MVEATQTIPGRLELVRAVPNPTGAQNVELFLLRGDATQAPVTEILPQSGIVLPSARSDLDDLKLKIAHFNDFHGQLVHLQPEGGEALFSRMVSRFEQLRAVCREDNNTVQLVLSAGDDLIGSLFSELMRYPPEAERIHPAYCAYSAAGIDICGIGNHDLDPGLGIFSESVQRDAHFPVLSANVRDCSQVKPVFHPAAILVTKGIRVGVVGLTTPAEDRKFNTLEFEITDPVQVCRNLLPALRPLCDVLIILSHLGLKLGSPTAPVEKAGDIELAEQLEPGWVDLIVGGHTHDALNRDGLDAENIVNHIPIVQAGAFGAWIGEVTLTLQQDVKVVDAHLSDVLSVPVHEDFEKKVIQPLVTRLHPVRKRILGRTSDNPEISTENLNQHFASAESTLANLLTDAIVERCHHSGFSVDLAVIDKSTLSTGLEPGLPLSFEAWYQLMPYLDNIQILTLSGLQLLHLLQDNALRLNGWGKPPMERGFSHFSETVRYTIQPGRVREESCAQDIMIAGQRLCDNPQRLFTVATSSFFRGLCRDWEKSSGIEGLLIAKEAGWESGCTRLFVRDEIGCYLEEHGGATEEAGLRLDGRLRVLLPHD
jgi:5'-nucleotidase / UDP-sugar diphosphatase